MNLLYFAGPALLQLTAIAANGQCVSDPVAGAELQFDIDYLFTGLDRTLGSTFPEWLSRYDQENTGDPSPAFAAEDNCGNGIDDDDHIELLGAILDGEPAATVLGGISSSTISEIRAGFTANRAKVKPDLTLQIVFVSVNIIDEINKDDPVFGESLQDLVAAYMTIGDEESVAYIRGLLITLGEIFIERGVDSGAIPSIVEGLVKSTLRSTVAANFVATRYACFGDASGTTKTNLLGDSGSINGGGLSNEAEYVAQGRDRQAWLAARGVTHVPLEITDAPEDTAVDSGTPISFAPAILGGNGGTILHDWKSFDASGDSTALTTEPALLFDYPIPDDTGSYGLFVCDGVWTRRAQPFALTVNAVPIRVLEQPQNTTRYVGETQTFRFGVAGGIARPSYQWLFGPTIATITDLPGAVDPELILDAVRPEDAGYYQVRLSSVDAGGAPVVLYSQAARLTVLIPQDTEPPAVTLIGAQEVTVECGTVFSDPGAQAEDTVDGNLTAAIEVTGSVVYGVPGTYTLTYRATDAAGNTGSATRTVHVADTTAPTIALFGASSLVLACGSPYVDPGITAADTCDTAVAVETSGAVDTATPGVYTLVYTAQDAAGLTAQVSREVTVEDNTPPTISLLGVSSLVLACGSLFTDPGVTAADTCDTAVVVETSGVVDASTPGEYTLVYTARDAAGLTAQVSRAVTVEDNTAPTISLLGASPLTLTCGSPYVDPGVTATDVCDGDLTAAVEIAGTVNPDVAGRYTRTYAVTDSSGNRAEVSRVVEVTDSAPPQIALIGANPLDIECGQVFADPGVTASDTCDGDISGRVSAGGAVDTQQPGEYEISYEVYDNAGHSARTSRTVRVNDCAPPVLTLLGADPLILACGALFTDPGATAEDACAGDVSTRITVTGTVNAETPGTYVRNYEVTDETGNKASVQRSVRVEDTDAPQITLLGDTEITLACGAVFTDPGAFADDPCEGDLTARVVRAGDVSTATPGRYELVYAVADSAGNPAEASRAVVVLNNCVIEITREPGPLSLYTGMDAVFRTAAEGGSAPLTYAWRKEGSEAALAEGPVFTIRDIGFDDVGNYYCDISDGFSTVRTRAVSLSVFDRPVVGGHAADTDGDWAISLVELLRIIQFYNGGGLHCAPETEDGYASGPGVRDCATHSADYAPADWAIGLIELLRIIQFYNSPGSAFHPDSSADDGYAPGAG